MIIVCFKNYLLEPLKQEFIDTTIVKEINEEATIFIAEPKYIVIDNLLKMPKLELVMTTRSGYDKVDFDYIKEHGIRFTNAKGLYFKTIAEDILNKALIYTNNSLIYFDNKLKRIYSPLRTEDYLVN